LVEKFDTGVSQEVKINNGNMDFTKAGKGDGLKDETLNPSLRSSSKPKIWKNFEVQPPCWLCIGQRPIDLHLKALEAMGAKIDIKGGYVRASTKDGLKGAKIIFDKITVGGTENIIMAGALAKGTTTIINSAKEPEVVQLCNILIDAGIEIDGVGTSTITIKGTAGEPIEFKDIEIIPDRN